MNARAWSMSLGITLLSAGAAHAAATVSDAAYGEDNCTLAAWPACPASGPCPSPASDSSDSVYHLDGFKLEPAIPAHQTSLSFVCPVHRTLFSGTGNTMKVQVSGQVPAQKAQSLKCTLYHTDVFGALLGSTSASKSTSTEGSAAQAFLSLSMSPGTPTGPYYVGCDLANDTIHNSSGGLYSYRSEETMTSPKNATSQSMFPTVCSPANPLNLNGITGSTPAPSHFRTLYTGKTNNGLKNVGSGSAAVTCAMPNITSASTPRHVLAYITEASASGAGSTCHLMARTPYYNNDMLAGVSGFTKTTSGSSAQRTLDFVDSSSEITDPVVYTLECTLKAGATINSIQYGQF
ncbi:MAG: hypothetical protein JWM82_1238 [Myxococcales bacterium]|nr:hypothetical protein [Myxococcales bacterium]